MMIGPLLQSSYYNGGGLGHEVGHAAARGVGFGFGSAAGHELFRALGANGLSLVIVVVLLVVAFRLGRRKHHRARR